MLGVLPRFIAFPDGASPPLNFSLPSRGDLPIVFGIIC